MEFDVDNEQGRRLVALGGLLARLGCRPAVDQEPHHGQRWLDHVLVQAGLDIH